MCKHTLFLIFIDKTLNQCKWRVLLDFYFSRNVRKYRKDKEMINGEKTTKFANEKIIPNIIPKVAKA